VGGYCGRLLLVNLSTKTISNIPLRDDLKEDYLGGSGIGARLLYELLGENIAAMDPLAPGNPLVFMTGPISGTTLPSTARMTVNALSPLTGIWGEANVGGQLSAQLKFAGWDGVIFLGAADSPVYLHVADEEAYLLAADELWGQETYIVTDLLQERHGGGNRKPAVAVIGPAGENGVLYASITHNKGHHFGRTGMGAVMGSKKLKGLVLSGTGKVIIGNPERYKEVRQRLLSKMKESLTVQLFNLYGTNCGIEAGHLSGDVPLKNWQLGEWAEGINALNGPAFETVLTDRATCYACPVACKRVVEVKDGLWQMAVGPGPEYETIASFGAMCLILDVAAIAKINERCNQLGLDTISCGCTIAFAIDCFAKGSLTTEQTGGLELRWGKPELVLKLVEMIAAQEGFGAELALGSHRLAEKLGGETRKYLATVKKLELPMHDPRAYHGLGLTYATSVRGACHVSGVSMGVEQGTMLLEELGLDGSHRGPTSADKARLVVLTQDFGMTFATAAIVCVLGGMVYDEQDFVACLSSVIGREWTLEEVMRCGRRNWLLKRAINLLRGAGPADDCLPEIVRKPLTEGGAAGSVADMELMLEEFYARRHFDRDGYPAREEMAALGLADVFVALEEFRYRK